MTEQTRKAISYALDFLSFLFLEKGAEDKVISAYIFGSAVRSELDKESDIDIFINCEKHDEDFISKAAKAAETKFLKSQDFDKWRGFNFTYPISIKTGPLHEWQLKTSIESEGIELYSKNVQQQNTERLVIFSFDLPKNKKSYLKIKREFFGRIEKHYKSEGIVSEAGGKQLASNIFIIPKTAQSKFIKIMHTRKINFSMMEIAKQKES